MYILKLIKLLTLMSRDRQFCLITNINVELLTLMSVKTTVGLEESLIKSTYQAHILR